MRDKRRLPKSVPDRPFQAGAPGRKSTAALASFAFVTLLGLWFTNASKADPSDRYYYCETSHAYYPFVIRCSVPWREILKPQNAISAKSSQQANEPTKGQMIPNGKNSVSPNTVDASETEYYHTKPGSVVGCDDPNDLAQANADAQVGNPALGIPAVSLQNSCYRVSSAVRWKAVRVQVGVYPGDKTALMGRVDLGNDTPSLLYFRADDMIDSLWHSPSPPPPPTPKPGTYAAGPLPKMNPCVGISPDAVVAAVNMHGLRSRANNKVFYAITSSPLHSTAINTYQPDGTIKQNPGLCAGYLTVTSGHGDYDEVMFTVELQPDGSIWFWPTAQI